MIWSGLADWWRSLTRRERWACGGWLAVAVGALAAVYYGIGLGLVYLVLLVFRACA